MNSLVHSREALVPGADLSALIARLEAAEGGSRELDALVAAALDVRPDWLAKSTGRLGMFAGKLVWLDEWVKKASAGSPPVECDPATTSLDAALALAERVLGSDDAIRIIWQACLDANHPSEIARYACIAILKAHASRAVEGE